MSQPNSLAVPQAISLADLTVANDGPVDPVEFTRRTAIAASSVRDFTLETAGPALDRLLALGSEPSRADPLEALALAEEVTDRAAALDAEVGRFTEMAKRV